MSCVTGCWRKKAPNCWLRLTKACDHSPRSLRFRWMKSDGISRNGRQDRLLSVSQPPHDLASFLIQETNRLAEEYQRLAPRAIEDPGTAGDQGEENWATLLRNWLPAHFHVVTKGRILTPSGNLSGQLDVFVLSPSYPPALLTTKHYLSAGVLAAFECKRTLRVSHLRSSFEQANKMKLGDGTISLASAYSALCSGPLFGVLAHSHAIEHASPTDFVTKTLDEITVERESLAHLLPDFYCISNLGAWTVTKMFNPAVLPESAKTWKAKSVCVGYNGPSIIGEQVEHFTPIGHFLWRFYAKLAWREEGLRQLARYFYETGIGGACSGNMHALPQEKYPSDFYEIVRPAQHSYDLWGHHFD